MVFLENQHREDDAEDDNAADHLQKEHILGFVVLADVLVGDGEQGVQGRGDNSQGNAQTVSGVELENEIDAAYREDAEQELAESLYRLIDLLGKADKSLILLYLDKIPYAQIAEIVGISEAAARKRVERIKQKLVILNTESNGKDI